MSRKIESKQTSKVLTDPVKDLEMNLLFWDKNSTTGLTDVTSYEIRSLLEKISEVSKEKLLVLLSDFRLAKKYGYRIAAGELQKEIVDIIKPKGGKHVRKQTTNHNNI